MRKMVRVLACLGTTLTAISVFGCPALASPIVANDPALAPYTLQYGDFSIVSLAFANAGTGTTNYTVQSSPGQLRNDIVVGTGAGGSYFNGVPGKAMSLPGSDNPYTTESGDGTSTYFATGNAISAPHPGPTGQFSNDAGNSWNIETSVLKSYLGGQNAVFYFNLNETGTTDVLSGTDLLIWAKVTITAGANPLLAPAESFYLAGNPFDPNGATFGKTQSILNGVPDPTASYPDTAPGSPYDPTDPRWTYVHGDICISGSTFLHYGSCVKGDKKAKTVNQDLGAKRAAFAGYNLTLDGLINNPLYANSTLEINWEMADEDNGYEQLFILASGATQRTVPEPASISVVAAGLALLGFFIGRRRKSRQ